MIELDCPWCEGPVRMDLATLAETGAFCCDGCRIEVELADSGQGHAAALAA